MSAREELPVSGTCSKCRSNTAFEPDEQYPDILNSVCCGWPPLNLPTEADE